MSEFQTQVLLVVSGVLAAFGALLWTVSTVRYQITSRHLRISCLGLPVRWIRLDNIKHISTKPVKWAEHWPNVFFANGRTLIIRKHRGLCRHLLITPKYPFEFKATLEQARNQVLSVQGRNVLPGNPGPLPGTVTNPVPGSGTPSPTQPGAKTKTAA